VSSNPFTPPVLRLHAVSQDPTHPAFATFGVLYAAEALWDLYAELPLKAEATLAQRRLEESVFWAVRAAGQD